MPIRLYAPGESADEAKASRMRLASLEVRAYRSLYQRPGFRTEPTFGSVVGVESKGLGKLSNGYRERCYGGDELQFKVRTARWTPSEFGDASANAELRKLGLAGRINEICGDCFTEVSASNNCECN